MCLFSFLLIELILNNVICKFYIQHVDTAMEIIENSYGEDLHYLLGRMAALCSFSCISGGKCENSRGCTDLVPLSVCNADISGHLIKHHLSRESVSEKDLTLARAGLLQITDELIEKMMVCSAHPHELGKYWQVLKTCQYPRHEERKSAIFGTYVVNFKTAREIKNIMGDTIGINQFSSWKLEKRNAPCKAWF